MYFINNVCVCVRFHAYACNLAINKFYANIILQINQFNQISEYALTFLFNERAQANKNTTVF